MEGLFLAVLGMSATGSLAILAVLLARLALRRAPKKYSYALWAVVLLRLLCPFALKSPISLAPSIQVEVPGDGGGVQVYAGAPSIDQVIYRQVDGYLTGVYARSELARLQEAGVDAPAPTKPAAPSWSAMAGAVWLAGCAALLGHSALSLVQLRRRLRWAVPLAGEKRVRLADHIPSPFVLGLFRPVIYLPSDLPEGERDYILLHERTHIRRCDHVTRALAWLAVAVHWFDPLVWLAFHLAGRDMEMSCDEAVLRQMGREIRADYATSLLRLSQGGKLPAGPLAFGGGDPQDRIKNILNYKKPTFWVAVLALAGVLYTGAALATDYAPGRLIDPDDIVSYTAVDSTSYTTTPHNTGVSTDADRQKDLADPAKQRPLSKAAGDELVRLINTYSKSVYGKGGLTLSGNEHHLVRMDCADGGWYLLDYWYWNGFCFDPFHAHGEDSYTTLVTHYGPDGTAGTTWQMECDFDRAYYDWRRSAAVPVEGGTAAPDGTGIDLSYEIGQTDGVPFVRMTGKVYGRELSRAVWSPAGADALFGPHPGGELTMEHTFESGGTSVAAWWADEAHTQVAVTTKMSVYLSSYMPCGWWEFTVDLSGEQGRVTEMVPLASMPALTGSDDPPHYLPASITDQEAVFAARVAAKLLTAAEDFYHDYDGPIPPGPSEMTRPTYSPDSGNGSGDVRIDGLGEGYMEWSFNTSPAKGSVYFTTDPAFFCPRLAGKAVEGSFLWGDEDRRTVSLVMNVNDERVSSGTVNGFLVHFVVDLEGGTVVKKDFESMVEGETLELTDEEMLQAAPILAELLRGAEAYWLDSAPAP